MLIVRLKQCEVAMADGRLDEAFETARHEAFRGDRRGQELIGRLARELVERGRAHAEAGRAAEASADCQKAAVLAGNTPEIAELHAMIAAQREKLAAVQADHFQANRLQAQLLAGVARHADAGQLTIGQAMLAAAVLTPETQALAQDLATRRAARDALLGRASAACDAGDWEAALQHLASGQSQDANAASAQAIIARIIALALPRVREAIEAGRLDQAGRMFGQLESFSAKNIELQDGQQALSQCRVAWTALQAGEPQRAAEALRLLVPLWPRARWISDVADRLSKVSDLLAEIRSGPLGLIALTPAPHDLDQTAAPPLALERKPRQQFHANALPRPAAVANGHLPGEAFLLQVDGVGSFWVFCKAAVTIGPANSAAVPDLALLADASTPQILLSRVDEDYFLKSASPVGVNGKPVVEALLAGGDKIALGPRCRFTFTRPNASSGTAALDLSGTRLTRADVRRVILLDREILIAPGAGAHVRCDELTAPIVLQPAGHGSDMLLRAADAVQINGKPAEKRTIIQPGQHVRVGTVSFVITRDVSRASRPC